MHQNRGGTCNFHRSVPVALHRPADLRRQLHYVLEFADRGLPPKPLGVAVSVLGQSSRRIWDSVQRALRFPARHRANREHEPPRAYGFPGQFGPMVQCGDSEGVARTRSIAAIIVDLPAEVGRGGGAPRSE